MPHARRTSATRDFMIAEGLLERVEDFDFSGRTILASRLGYRITPLFVDRFLGRLFETPDAVFTEEMLRPEKQSLELFAAGVDAIVEAQRRVALNYFEDGSVEAACPPLKALLHIMAHGEFEGMGLDDPRLSRIFSTAKWCSKASGISSGYARSRNGISRCGSGTWQPCRILSRAARPRLHLTLTSRNALNVLGNNWRA